MGRLDGKVALITGAARGMGESHARLFAQHGAKVIATDRRDQLGQEAVASICAAGGDAMFLAHDVTDENQWQSVIAKGVERYGKIDILINNAAFAAFHSAEESSLEDWSRVMDVCVKSIFLGCKFILPAMQKAGGGSIVNISSIAGLGGMPKQAAYQAGKGAVRILTKSLAVDYARYNIRANSVHPGMVRTPGTRLVLEDETFSAMISDKTILKRVAEPLELSYPVLFLASDEASFVTGAEVVVDGGYMAQ
ncbi:MAG: SDR family NAD(P)-dependent oxidoreductase [Porticoccaceae bacterium]